MTAVGVRDRPRDLVARCREYLYLYLGGLLSSGLFIHQLHSSSLRRSLEYDRTIPLLRWKRHDERSYVSIQIRYHTHVFHKGNGDVVCTGIKAVIKEGYKSFPSEHTSWSFAGLGFLSWYLSRKVRVFDRRGNIGKLCLVLLPLLIAALVGITRVDDYWRHWTDVFVGGLIGLTVSSICYLLLFSLPTLPHGWAPHVLFHMMGESDSPSQRGSQTPHATRLDEFTLQMTEMESGTRYVNV
ncbi:hypothetical protein JHK86_031663 [Glycine max]|nr:hypothetical protein JHK86_031663 [Glycine max]